MGDMMQVEQARRTAALAVLALSGWAALTAGCATQATAASQPEAPKVSVVAAEHHDIPLESAYTGRVEAVHTVELRPRVSGALDAVMFREGSYVARGTALFRIDPRPYTIALRRAEAVALARKAGSGRAGLMSEWGATARTVSFSVTGSTISRRSGMALRELLLPSVAQST